MQYVGKLMSSVYNTITPNINPSTLTGAIDVIVVEREVETEESVSQPDGTTLQTKRRTTELAASPFHVRFGKMSVLRPAERKVTLHLNGSPNPLPFAMKVSENGEAFFVMKVDAEDALLSDAQVTSPIVGPTDAPDPDPAPLDIGASDTPAADAESPEPSTSDNFSAPFGVGSVATPPVHTEESDALDTVPSPDLVRTKSSYPDVLPLDLDVEGYKLTEQQQKEALAEGHRLADEMPLARRHGGHGSMGFSERLDRPRSLWRRQAIWHPPEAPASSSTSTSGSEADASAAALRRRASDSTMLLSATRPRNSVQDPQRLARSLSDSALLARCERDEPAERTEPEAVTGAVASDEGDGMGTLTCAEADPYLFQLQIDANTVYTFELSLCNSPPFDPHDASQAEFLFDEGRVSFQRFLEDASIADDARLCIRHNDTYHVRTDEAGMFSTLTMYRDALLHGDSDISNPPTRASVWQRLWRGKPAAPVEPAKAAAAPQPNGAEPAAQETYVKTLRLSSDQLKQLNLYKGMNTITFSVTSSYSGVAKCCARIFLWDAMHPVVVSDIDGTITKSDALGHVFTLMGRDWTHLGVAKLYHDIAKNGYRVMYLTSRAIGQADITRDYLKNINQNNFRLPDGPVIMSPDRLIASLHREVILRKPEVFKMACLRDIARLFGVDPRAPGDQATPFYAGFGNRITDALSYRSVNIPSSRIFTIDSNGEVKMELLELAGYKSSYPNMTDLVDQMFPPVPASQHESAAKSNAFSDLNYWRSEPAEVELPPDEELMSTPVPIASSPTLRGLRSPRQIPRSSVDASEKREERPGRLSRLFGLRRRPTDGAPSAAAQPSPESASTTPMLSQSPSRTGILYSDELTPPEQSGDDDEDMSPEARRRRERRERSMLSASSLSLDGLSRRQRGRTDEDEDSGLQNRAASSTPTPAHETEDATAPDSPAQRSSDDPLLASGEIQFEWRG